MLEKHYYKIDFSTAKDYWDIHKILDDSLDFAEPYVRNLDSLFDRLTDMLCDISIIEIHGLEELEKYDGYDKRLIEVFSDTKHAWGQKSSNRFLVTIVHKDGKREEMK